MPKNRISSDLEIVDSNFGPSFLTNFEIYCEKEDFEVMGKCMHVSAVESAFGQQTMIFLLLSAIL